MNHDQNGRFVFPPIEDRIAPHIKVVGACREWTGACAANKSGPRPTINRDKKTQYVYRVVWELAFGPIPKGLCVCHTCDNGKCLRTSHFFLGTQQANLRDMRNKGRGFHGRVPQKLTTDQVREIRARAGQTRTGLLAKEFGIAKQNIRAIISGKAWRHIL